MVKNFLVARNPETFTNKWAVIIGPSVFILGLLFVSLIR